MQNIPKNYLKTINNAISFFDKHAYLEKEKVYLSELNDTGKVISNKIFTVALNRLIYGLSYSSKFVPQNMERAKLAASFYQNKMLKEDALGKYAISFIENDTCDNSKLLDIWQQAYALCGLTELYRNSPDKELLSNIDALHKGFVSRFHDSINGGFNGNYHLENGKIMDSKSLQSLMYPITAYLENLWISDKDNKKQYEAFLKENVKIAYQRAWNDSLNWVNVQFDEKWNAKTGKNVTPGHNFQLASLFLRTKNWVFLSEEEKSNYRKLGMEIIEATLKKPIFDGNEIKNGFYSEVSSLNDSITDKRKTWWQHCEAIIALSLCNGKYDKEQKLLENFFFTNFIDRQNGSEFFFLDKDNTPIKTELKGSIGKSAYHTMEMIKFLLKGN